jgi:isopentenyl-diphosphate delta-isomerase
MVKTFVLLINEADEPLGIMEKLEAHQKGKLHRAFSVFIFNDKGELLLQKRAPEKYHSGGLWSNTCCGHPLQGPRLEISARLRLKEEMGFDCKLTAAFHFIYRAELNHELTEHELDHVFVGCYNDIPVPDPLEVSEWKYESPLIIQKDMEAEPQNFTSWFHIAFPKLMNYLLLEREKGKKAL